MTVIVFDPLHDIVENIFVIHFNDVSSRETVLTQALLYHSTFKPMYHHIDMSGSAAVFVERLLKYLFDPKTEHGIGAIVAILDNLSENLGDDWKRHIAQVIQQFNQRLQRG